VLGPVEEKKLRDTIKVHEHIFRAFVTAVVLYTVLAYFVTAGSTRENFGYDTLRWVLISLSLGAAAVKFWVQIWQADETSYEKCESLGESLGKYAMYFFVSLAMAEIPALCGLIMVFITMRMAEWWVFAGISAILFATSVPKYHVLENIVITRLVRNPDEAGTLTVDLPPEVDDSALDAAGDFELPSLQRRALAFIIDLTAAIAFCYFVFRLPIFEMEWDLGNFGAAVFFAYIVYQAIFIYLFKGTIGCVFTGLKIVPATATGFNFVNLFIRGFEMSVIIWSLFPVLLIVEIVFLVRGIRNGTNEYRRASWDHVGKTIVIRPK
jgi:hypothetical protein